MTCWRSRSHPKSGLVVATIGLLIAFGSIWPWAQRPNNPTQAVYAGDVGDQRTQLLMLGLAIAVIGLAVYCSAWRFLLVAAAGAALASFLIARGAVGDVSAITADGSELVGEVGWALYWIEAAALVVIVASILGMWSGRAPARSQLPL